jgi:hypothetical protein
MVYIIAFYLIFILLLLIFILTTKHHRHCRVSCRWCGQWFDMYEDVDDHHKWYEPVGEDLQHKCICRYIIGK